MTATTTPAGTRDLARLKASASVLLGLILVQLVFAIITLIHHNDTIAAIHGGFGYLSLITGVVAAWFAWRWTRESGAKGTFFHTLSLPILAVIQIGLIQGGLKWVHVVVGILYLVAVVGLWTMLRRR